MPDWRRNVLSTSEAFIDALQKGSLDDEPLASLDPIAASYPRRRDRLRAPATCPYTTIFLGTAASRKNELLPPLPSACCEERNEPLDLYADAHSVDRSSNLTDTSSFAHYEDRREDEAGETCVGSRPDERLTLKIQKVPHTASVFYVSARSDAPAPATPASEVYLVDADSDALSSCTCDSFERCEFDCKDYEPFSDTCCCEPNGDGGCSRSPGHGESPERFCERWPEDDGVSARSDMEGLDLTLFEPAAGAPSQPPCAGKRVLDLPASVPARSPAAPRNEHTAMCGVLHSTPPPDKANDCVSVPARGAAPATWEPYYCVLLQDRRTFTAYSSEELANNKNGDYATRSLPRVRLDGGSGGGAGAGSGVRLRCWAAPPSITEEDVEEPDADIDTTSLRAVSVTDTSYEKACRRGSAPSTPLPLGGGAGGGAGDGAAAAQHSPSRLAAFFFSKRSFRSNPLKRTKSATKLERERLAAAQAHPATHALRTSRSHESLLSAHSPAVSTMDLGPPHQVEIRALHSSVLGRPHCFALSAENRAPRYFACASRKQRDRWIFSLRQAARPEELRGRRCERALKLWLLEAKAIPAKKRYYCEIMLDDVLYARTSSKLKTELCFWGEVYEFSSLPAVGTILINVYREPERRARKRDKRHLVGSVKIPVDDVSSRYLNERWYPIQLDKSADKSLNSSQHSAPAAPSPSLRIKCRYQVVDVLPIDIYADFLEYLKKNYKKLCECLEPVIGVKAKEDIGCALVLCMAGCGLAPRYLADVVALDVRRTGDHSLTFRGNSLATKSMEAYLKLVGDQYLQDTLTEAVNAVAGGGGGGGADCEVDPLRAGGAAALRRQQAALRDAVELTWRRISGSSQLFPAPLRDCFSIFRERLSSMGRDDISDNLISASIFLRFFCPAILSPSLFGITHEYPNERAARNLTLVAKTLQTLANFTRFQGKEAFMEFLNDFLEREAPRMKTFLRDISSRPPGQQAVQQHQEALKRLSGASQHSSATQTSENTYREARRVEPEPEWAPHVDLGKQLATLHGLLVDSLTKLPPSRIQELDPLSDILDDLSKRQLATENGSHLHIADNIFRFNDPTCNAQQKLGPDSVPTTMPTNFAHSSPLNKTGVQFNISPSKSNAEESKFKSSYASIAKSPSFNMRSATLPRNGYASPINQNVNPDRYSSQYNNQEHCVNLKVVQIGFDQYSKGLTNGENGNERRHERFKPNNFNQMHYHNSNYNTERSPSSDSMNHNYAANEMQNLIRDTANLEELSDLLKYADDTDNTEDKQMNKKNLNHSNNNIVNGNKNNYTTNGSNVSISALSNVASSGYQSFATYSQSSSPIESTGNHLHPYEGQPLSRYSQLNYKMQKDKFYPKNPIQQKIDYDIQKYGIQNFTTDNGQNNANPPPAVAPLIFTNPVYNMDDNRQSPARVEKNKINEKQNSKRCPCGSSSSSIEEETTDHAETNSEEGSTNRNEEVRPYERHDRTSTQHRKLTRDGDYNNTNHEHSPRDDSSNAPSLRKGGKTRMPRTNPMLSYSNNQNQLNLKHFGQRGESLYESKPHHITSEGYPMARSDSNVEEVNKEMYRLQMSRSQKAVYNMENAKNAPDKYSIPENVTQETNYPLDRTYSGARVSSTRLNEDLDRNQDVYYCMRERDSPSKTAASGQSHSSEASHDKSSIQSTPKEKLQRRLSLESARELTDSSSDMDDTHYSTTGRRRTNKHHRTIEQYEREIERLRCSVELLRGRLGPAETAGEHVDAKTKGIISRLICVEEELRREKRKMAAALSHKQRVIEAQEHRIAALDEANTRLLSALVHLQRTPTQHHSHAELQI